MGSPAMRSMGRNIMKTSNTVQPDNGIYLSKYEK